MGKRKSKRGRSVKRNSQRVEGEPETLTKAPHSFVIHRGIVGGYIVELTNDFRKVMEPFTASSLKARKKNTIKDFVSVSGLLHVSHMCIFTHTALSTYLKIIRFPRGPTLTFRVHNYCLARDVRSTLKKQCVYDEQFKHAPLIVLNSFSGEGMHLKLMASMFQNMFPTININKVNLNTIRRVVLLNYNPTSKLIDFRHYAIRVAPVGISKGVKKIVSSKVPNLSRFGDISDFIAKAGCLSDSEAEDDPASHVTLPQKLSSRGNQASNQSSIRLIELGPRLTLQLMKVENGLLNGEVLYHEFVHKTEEELLKMKKQREDKRRIKENRRRVQEENKKKKDKKKEELKQKSLKGMHKKTESEMLMQQAVNEANEATNDQEGEVDDAEWYRQEVGEEPDADMFDGTPTSTGKRKRPYGGMLRKMKKLEKQNENPENFQKFKKRKHDSNSQKYKSSNSKDNFVKKTKLPSTKKKVLGSKISKKHKRR